MPSSPVRLNRSNYSTLFVAGSVLFFALGMVFYPVEVFSASTRGLSLWWEVVLPSILPFLITAEIMIGLGILHFLGALLEPLMRPLFNLPGTAAFVVAMGFTSGFPVGAVLTGRLRRSKLCTRLEGERLLCFTNNASPLFILAAVPVGMLGLPAAGIYLAGVSYGTNLLIGLLFRFYGRSKPFPIAWRTGSPQQYRNPLHALLEGRKDDGRPLGKLMGDAVKSAIVNLAVIGGFIVFFSVLIRLITVLGIWQGLVSGASAVMGDWLSPGLLEGLNIGIWEITLGCQSISSTTAPWEIKIALVGFLLGWAGLAIHAQVASMIADTDLRFTPFLLSRILHGVISAVALYAGFHFDLFSMVLPTMASLDTGFNLSWGASLWFACKVMGGSLAFLLLLAFGRGALSVFPPFRSFVPKRPSLY